MFLATQKLQSGKFGSRLDIYRLCNFLGVALALR